MASEQLLADIERHEGFVAQPYVDSEGYWTRGFGEHDGVNEHSAPVTREEALANLAVRLDKARADARAVAQDVVFDRLDSVRADALTELAYNLGKSGLASFTPFLGYVRQGDYSSAAYHLLVNTSGQLQKYTTQVKARAVEIALRIATGTVLPEFIVKS